MTKCKTEKIAFQAHGQRLVETAFDGGHVVTDGGALLLREVERVFGVISAFSSCFHDRRDSRYTEFEVEELAAQRIMGLALGYDDLNDHDELRRDLLLSLACGVEDITGKDRLRERDRGAGLAGKSTLNRPELTAEGAADSPYRKIDVDAPKAMRSFSETFVRVRSGSPPEELVLDIDATDDPLYGRQEGRYFNGYYDSYCYLPLYVFCEDFPLWAEIRTADAEPASGAVNALSQIVEVLRETWPGTRLILRGDSGFCRDQIMTWCEANGVDFILGIAKNDRLRRFAADALAEAKAEFEQTGCAARVFTEFQYSTEDSWNRERRVIAKAEHLEKGSNPRFVVTSLRGRNQCPKSL